MPVARPSAVTLAATGLAGGVFAALFGVGGGLVVVPLLVLLAGFSSRLAAGTSLAAIGFTSAFGALVFGVLGDVDWVAAVTVGLPAVVGVLAGVALQQRLSQRVAVLLFSCFLVAVAVRLLL